MQWLICHRCGEGARGACVIRLVEGRRGQVALRRSVSVNLAELWRASPYVAPNFADSGGAMEGLRWKGKGGREQVASTGKRS